MTKGQARRRSPLLTQRGSQRSRSKCAGSICWAVGLVSVLGSGCVDYRKEARKSLEGDGLTDLELKEIGRGSFEVKARKGAEVCRGTIGIKKSGSTTNAIRSLDCSPVTCTNEQLGRCKRWCQQGEAKICWTLGVIYDHGRGAAKDPKKAVSWYQKACDGGHAAACNDLADHFVKGNGVGKDPLKATKLFEKACDHGNTLGCANLGLMYHSSAFFGRTFPRKAAPFLRKACDADHAASCGRLAGLYASGSGVAKDVKKASELYDKACNSGVGTACFNLGLLCEGGGDFPEDLPRALRSFQKACKLGTDCAFVERVKRAMTKKKARATH